VRGALKKGRNRNIAAAAVLGGGGLLLGANAIRNRNQRKP